MKLLLATFSLFFAQLTFAIDVKPYNAAALAEVQKAGKTVAVHFHADWCPTCVNQAKAIDSLKADAQLKPIVILVADYDKEKELRKSLRVRSQSVFVVFKGDKEITRIAGDTDPAKIKTGLAKAL